MPTQLTNRETPNQVGQIRELYSMPIDPVTYTASHTLGPEDLGKVIYMNSASANDLTVLQESAQTYPPRPNTTWVICQDGAGATTVVAGSGVTIRTHADDTLVLNGAGSYAMLIYRGSNVYNLTGKLVPA